MPDWHAITNALRDDFGVAVDGSATPRSVSGGDINAAWRLETNTRSVFLKTADAAVIDMFSAEADGLEELGNANAVRVPVVLGFGTTSLNAWIALEWLEFSPTGNAHEELLGRQLAQQHRVTAKQHGWHRDNTIGLTRQPNARMDDWVRFFREQRLEYQLDLAERNGYGGELQAAGKKLSAQLERLFDAYAPEASLLHGDLWGGNWAAVGDDPVIFDPAVYFGDRETDLAMTRLFGGFGARFYDAYEECWPLADGADERCRLYQLYHVLNHLNLFGRGYLGRSMQLIQSLL